MSGLVFHAPTGGTGVCPRCGVVIAYSDGWVSSDPTSVNCAPVVGRRGKLASIRSLLRRRSQRRPRPALDAALQARREVLATPGGRAYLESLGSLQPEETLTERYFQVLLSITEDARERERIMALARRAGHRVGYDLGIRQYVRPTSDA